MEGVRRENERGEGKRDGEEEMTSAEESGSTGKERGSGERQLSVGGERQEEKSWKAEY